MSLLGLEEDDLRGQPGPRTAGRHNLLEPEDSAPRGPAHPRESPPAPALPGKSLAAWEGRRRPCSEARPSGQSIRALFAPTWSPEEPQRAGSGPGQGRVWARSRARKGGRWHQWGPGPGPVGSRSSVQAPPDSLSRTGEERVGVGSSRQFGLGLPRPRYLGWAGPSGLGRGFSGAGDSAELQADGCLPSTHRPLPPTSGMQTWESHCMSQTEAPAPLRAKGTSLLWASPILQ
nr:translation initiation factor IF-2-like isoform X2 [Gorilla gorilla gorilla]